MNKMYFIFGIIIIAAIVGGFFFSTDLNQKRWSRSVC